MSDIALRRTAWITAFIAMVILIISVIMLFLAPDYANFNWLGNQGNGIVALGAPILGLSGFLTLAYDPMKDTVAALKAADLDVRTMIGGGQIDEQVREYTGADAYGRDAMSAVTYPKEWTGAIVNA